jgi:precorrin-8X/cobalt-precorrin-8 methylmutase
MIDYLKDPAAIYEKSFAIIAAEADFSTVPENARRVATRMIHACGVTGIAKSIVVSEGFVAAAKSVLNAGAKILVDAEMVRHGIISSLLPDREQIICTLNDQRTPGLAAGLGNTRSAAAVELWRPRLSGAVVVIGNAPTALFHLIDMLDAGAPKPAAIVGLPVGFVGAAESKEHLITRRGGIPILTLRGRQGGSAMAAAVINALLEKTP